MAAAMADPVTFPRPTAHPSRDRRPGSASELGACPLAEILLPVCG